MWHGLQWHCYWFCIVLCWLIVDKGTQIGPKWLSNEPKSVQNPLPEASWRVAGCLLQDFWCPTFSFFFQNTFLSNFPTYFGTKFGPKTVPKSDWRAIRNPIQFSIDFWTNSGSILGPFCGPKMDPKSVDDAILKSIGSCDVWYELCNWISMCFG